MARKAKPMKAPTNKEQAKALMAQGSPDPPWGYCKRCWKAATVTKTGSRKTPARCPQHNAEIQEELRSAAVTRRNREEMELNATDDTYTAMKWLARLTGAGYENSPPDLTEVIYDAFWKAMPDTSIPTKDQIETAYQAGLKAFQEYTGITPEPARCPQCGDRNPDSRNGNNFKCLACGWSSPDGAFGAIYISMMATQQAPVPDSHTPERQALLNQLKTDYGYDDHGWHHVHHIFDDLSDAQIQSQLNPSEAALRLTWVLCSNCDEIHEELEPTDRPEYHAALIAARSRDNS